MQVSSGSMLISGRNMGQVRLDLRPDSIKATATRPQWKLDDLIVDVQQKLDSIKSSPTPVQGEIDFLEEFLRRAKGE